MAPEILKGEKYTNKVDIWSLGAMLYKLTTKKYPFNSNHPPELFRKIINDNPEALPAKFDEDTRKLLFKML